MTVYSIGEFSKISGLTVKALRLYHEQGLLVPTYVDGQTGYRYYDATQIESARLVARLRALEFSLEDVRAVLTAWSDAAAVAQCLTAQKKALAARAQHYRRLQRQLDELIAAQQEPRAMARQEFAIEEKHLPLLLVAGIRMRGKYADCGRGFGLLGRRCGRFICGTPLMLIYDSEYKEDDADFEPCMPIRQAISVPGIAVRELPAGLCVSLIHEGPYDELSHSYARLLDYVHEKGHEIVMPTREVYLRGPGMILRGNPRKYLTEIQLPVRQSA